MPRKTFDAELLDGHNGPAVLVPFDPTEAWGALPVPVDTAAYGKIAAHPVAGTMNRRKFEGCIVRRWGKHFILVDDALQRAARVAVGDVVRVVVAPAKPARRNARRSADVSSVDDAAPSRNGGDIMAKRTRGTRMAAAKRRAAKVKGGKGRIRNRRAGKHIMKT